MYRHDGTEDAGGGGGGAEKHFKWDISKNPVN